MHADTDWVCLLCHKDNNLSVTKLRYGLWVEECLSDVCESKGISRTCEQEFCSNPIIDT